MTSSDWFEYLITVQPHHTDYAGIVWHGTYVSWLEEARIACLQTRGLTFADWVKAGVDLPVIDIALKYRQSLNLGDQARVKTRLAPKTGVRMVWQYDIQNHGTGETCLSGTVTLVPVDMQSRKILRRLPDPLQTVVTRLPHGEPI